VECEHYTKIVSSLPESLALVTLVDCINLLLLLCIYFFHTGHTAQPVIS
jgi:hypothetical protein